MAVEQVAYIYQCKFGDDCDFVSLGGGDEQREDKIEYGEYIRSFEKNITEQTLQPRIF